MAKNKTAKIRVNHIFGTKNGFCADVLYRGRLLFSIDGENPQELLQKARAWATGQGFNRHSVIFG